MSKTNTLSSEALGFLDRSTVTTPRPHLKANINNREAISKVLPKATKRPFNNKASINTNKDRSRNLAAAAGSSIKRKRTTLAAHPLRPSTLTRHPKPHCAANHS